MNVLSRDTLPIRSTSDVVAVRRVVRQFAIDLGFSLVEQTKIVTAASEITRNTLEYGGGGVVSIEALQSGLRYGLKMVFEDEGPGIPDIDRALSDGYSTGKGLGLGLGGTKRLVTEFQIRSEIDKGTSITIIKWK